ncbi:arylamine N-acetyltransferase family protein [Xanthovirga aplysinae]|uniref:arylamine N-acetyltransferase family protein n=1 Tax=Xanthovirga aplysinae TaxID=2529853 RepID=UPI0012BCAB9E|nr:arylamine N-acetyltransferase [Xanthovirga aplysinae]MTI31201.1 acetyltransferase [Xanthovirga aplysinae]
MDFRAYLKRINFKGEISPTLKVLQKLQKSHLLKVPFENLDIHYGIPIELNLDKIYDKIVLKKRGGFCYELNGLFYELLSWIGFNVKRISARVYDKEKGYGQEYDHMAMIVNIDGTNYLTDVGFGEFTFAPLKLELEKIQEDERGSFVFDQYDEGYFRVNKIENDEWAPEYIFKNIPRSFQDFSSMCLFHQTSPKSHFTQKKLITLPTIEGRITLTSQQLKKSSIQTIREIKVKDDTEFESALKDYFHLDATSFLKNNKGQIQSRTFSK